MKTSIVSYWAISRDAPGMSKYPSWEEIFEEKMVNIFINMMKTTNSQMQESQPIGNKANTIKTNDKEKILKNSQRRKTCYVQW